MRNKERSMSVTYKCKVKQHEILRLKLRSLIKVVTLNKRFHVDGDQVHSYVST